MVNSRDTVVEVVIGPATLAEGANVSKQLSVPGSGYQVSLYAASDLKIDVRQGLYPSIRWWSELGPVIWVYLNQFQHFGPGGQAL